MFGVQESGQVVLALGYLVPLLVAAGYDLKEFRIPNLLVLCYAAITALCIMGFQEPALWWRHLLAGVVTLSVGIFLFNFRWLGGGDVKLLAVLGLWLGVDALPVFMYILCIMGGAVCVFLFLLRRCLHIVLSRTGQFLIPKLPSALRIGERIPYAVPIAMTAIFTAPLIVFS